MEARRPKEGGPRSQIPWPHGTTHLGPRGSVAVDLSSRSFDLDLKTTIKIVSRFRSEGRPPKT